MSKSLSTTSADKNKAWENSVREECLNRFEAEYPGTLLRLRPYLQEQEHPGKTPFVTVSSQGVRNLSSALSITEKDAMRLCLHYEVWPLRFKANRGVFSSALQAALLEKCVLIAGCGGLGGYMATLLARAGVGYFILCDYDVFEESNLNRQLLCREDTLGCGKAETTKKEIARIASYTSLKTVVQPLDASNIPTLLASPCSLDETQSLPLPSSPKKDAQNLLTTEKTGKQTCITQAEQANRQTNGTAQTEQAEKQLFMSAQAGQGERQTHSPAQVLQTAEHVCACPYFPAPNAVVDCLDSIPTRLLLQNNAQQAGIPFIHGAIAGLEGFIGFKVPGSNEDNAPTTTKSVELKASNKGPEANINAEKKAGMPTPTPALTAALQSWCVLQTLLSQEPKENELWHLDLSIPEIERFLL